MTNNHENVALFVTHVQSTGPLLRIWGQVDQEAARQIETLINILMDKFDRGIGTVTPQTILNTNTICCAYHEDNYYRAEILHIHSDYHVHIKFIDYGNEEIVHPSTIRLLDSISEGIQLQSLPPIAYGFALTNIMPINNCWIPKVIEHLKHQLRYCSHPAIINKCAVKELVKLEFQGQDLVEYIISAQMGTLANPEQLRTLYRLAHDPNLSKPLSQPAMYEASQPVQQFLPYNNNNFTKPPNGRSSLSPPKYNNPGHQENWRQPRELYKPPSQRIQVSQSSKTPENLPFKCRVLPQDSVHQVRVSHIHDGPLRFVIQLQSCDEELNSLMRNINNYPVEPLVEPQLPGYVCLGRCTKDKRLRRAVINSSTEGSTHTGVYYVDFGDSESLPYSEIYELPPQYVNPRVLSVRFCLTGIRELKVTQEMKKFFAEFVKNKLLTLKVQPVEDTPLIQYCTLHDGEKSVLDILKETFCDSTLTWPQSQILPRATEEMVHVAYVAACNKFFVHLRKDSSSLETITNSIVASIKSAPHFQPGSIKPGVKCFAQSTYDGQWYRGEVISIFDDQVNVHYVDYGNDETISTYALRSVGNEELAKKPALAIQCKLSGFDAGPINPTTDEKFEELVLDKPLVMSVIDVESPVLIVDLYDTSKKPIINVSATLRNLRSADANSNYPQNSQQGSGDWAQKTNNEERTNERTVQPSSNDTRYPPQYSRNDRNHASRDSTPRLNQTDFKGKYSSRDKNVDNWSDKDSNASSKSRTKRGDYVNTKNNNGARQDNTRSYSRNVESDNSKFQRTNGSVQSERRPQSQSNNTIDTWQTPNTKNQPDAYSNVSIPPPNITLGVSKHCEVVFSTSPNDFYIQLIPDNAELDAVMTKITDIYNNGGNNLPETFIKPGISCVAQYSEDFTWYRAIIESVKADGAEIRFVDYGNTELVTFDKLKQLQEDLAKLPIQAIACKLLAVTPKQWDQAELEEFSALSDGKTLEAEFISLENETYEVLLREVGQRNFINEKFVPEIDLMAAREIARNKNRPGRGKITTTVPDYAPATAKWIESTINLGSEQDIMVTWLQNPSKFYVQLISSGDEFRNMMMEIQKCYAKREPTTDQLGIGSPVMAIFAEDGAIYRAEIVDVKPTGILVRYIDFGNCAMVKKEKVYKVENKFMKLPRLGLECSLSRIIPVNGSWDKWNIDAAQAMFDADDIKCTFEKRSGEKYIVELKKNGKDLAEALVNKGLGAFPPVEKIAEPQEIQDVQQPCVGSDEHLTQVDINCLLGQTLRVKISNVESVDKFHIQLPSAAASDRVITNFMKNADSKVMSRLSSHEVCLGSGCLVQTVDGWKRAVVINSPRRRSFQVRYIDSGAIDVIPLESMLMLPAELAVMQKQAVECCLKDVVSSAAANEKFKDLADSKEFIIHVDAIENTRLIVRLFDEGGHRIKISGQKRKFSSENDEECISPICPLPLFSSLQRVIVSHINSSANIWLKRVTDAVTDASLLQELYDFYTSSGKPLTLAPNKLCAAQSADGNWYRATTLHLTESGALVQFVDYGNTEEIPAYLLKELDPIFWKQSALAIETSLSLKVRGSHEEQAQILNTYLLDKEFDASIYNIHNKWIVELMSETGEKFTDQLYHLDVVATEDEMIEKPAKEPSKLTVGVEFGALVSHIESPTQFWLQRISDFNAIDTLQEKLQSQVSSFEEIQGIPEEKLICVALYSVDNLWYRAEVIDAAEGLVTVRFIDYGNTDVIIESSKIKYLPESLRTVEFYAIKCGLAVTPVSSDDWSEHVCERFTAIIGDEESLKAVILAEGNTMQVDLIINNQSATDILVSENLARKVQAHEKLINEVVEVELDPRSAFVSHINSPSEFWVQEEKSVSDLELISDRFLVAEMFPALENPQEGQLCAAKFPEDQLWYRARIVSSGESGINVIYIDYGNSAVSTEIRQIPQDLVHIPPLSRKSALALPAGVEAWSRAACDKFCEMADDGATVFLLDVIEEGETSIVKLTLNDQDIVDSLECLCEKKPVADVAAIQNITSEETPAEISNDKPKIVYVSHTNSLNEFWVQEQNSSAELDAISDVLSIIGPDTAEMIDGKVGAICIAKFPEDSLWYRAQILSQNDNEFNVLYIDYGNCSVATEIRKIPSDIASIPPLARKCSLAFSAGQKQWSSEASSEFLKLAGDGLTPLTLEIIHEDDEISMIKLTHEGQDVAEKLATLGGAPVDEIIEERLTPLGEENSPNILVSHVVSPGEFWTQAESKIVDLETMADHLMNAHTFLALDTLEEGTICAAKFPEDEQWYRAKILCHGESETEVLYIDYGNSAVTTEIRALPSDLSDIPPLSKLCALKLPKNIDNWSKEACEKFIELVDEGVTMFAVEELNGSEPIFVKLLLNGQDVTEILAPLCQSIDKSQFQPQNQHLNTSESSKESLQHSNAMDSTLETTQDINDVFIKVEQSEFCTSLSDSTTSGVDGLTTVSEHSESHSFSTKHESSTEGSDNLMDKSIIKRESIAESTMIESNDEQTCPITVQLSVDDIVGRFDQTPSVDEPEFDFGKNENLADSVFEDKNITIDLTNISDVITSETIGQKSTQMINRDTETLDEEITSFMDSTGSHEDVIPEAKFEEIIDILSVNITKTLPEKLMENMGAPTRPKTPLSEKLVAGVVTDHNLLTATQENDEVLEIEVVDHTSS